MRQSPLRILLLLLLITSAPFSEASADTPGFLDGEVLDEVCARLRLAEQCPKCTCEPVTQSNPTQDWTKATLIPTGTLVLISGARDAEMVVKALHVVLGSEKGLYLGGKVVDLSAHTRASRKSSYRVVKSAQHYDMCSDACRHSSVGAVHLFEIEYTVDDATDDTDRGEHLESVTRELASCYMADDKEPAVCYVTTLGYENRLTYTGKKKKPMKGWGRTWAIGGKLGMSLAVGPIRGKDAKSARKEAVGQAPRTSTFDRLEKRGDTVKATEKGQGSRLPITLLGRNRPPTR